MATLPRSHAQPAGRPWRIGYLSFAARPADGKVPSPLRQGIQAFGLIEDRDVIYEGRWAETHRERLAGLAADLLAQKVDLLLSFGFAAAAAAQKATTTVPIVVLYAGDVVETGLVASLAHPGGNVTGVNDPAAELSAKRLEILKQLVPTTRRVAVLWNADNYAMTLRFKEIQRAAEVLNVGVTALGVREPDDFDTALAAMNSYPPDAIMMVTDALTTLNRQRVIDYAAVRRIPDMYEFASVVRAGGLVSYGADESQNVRLAAAAVAKIVHGARPAEVPIEQPNEYFLVINIKTARRLGLSVPQALLLQAQEIID